jgi:hypothetical protein
MIHTILMGSMEQLILYQKLKDLQNGKKENICD